MKGSTRATVLVDEEIDARDIRSTGIRTKGNLEECQRDMQL